MDEGIRTALGQRRVRITLTAILAVVVLVALIIIYSTVSSPTINDPSDIAATAVSHSRIDLSWQDNSDNESGFKIEHKTGAGGSYTEIGTVGPNVTTYSDTGLSPETTYFYRVRAYNESGDSPYADEVSAVTLTPTIPNAPSNLVALTVSSSSIDLSWWDNSENEAGFQIERKIGAEGSYSKTATVGADITSYSDVGLIDSTTYYYRVRAYSIAGSSLSSNEDSAMTLEPEYHAVGTSALGSKRSLSIISVTKTDRYCDYHMFVPRSSECFAPTGTAFIAILLSTTNHSNDIIGLKRVDFGLRDSATRGIYALFDYPRGPYPAGGSGLGEPFPINAEIHPDQTINGVILYLVPETASLSEMEVVCVLDDTAHVWQP